MSSSQRISKKEQIVKYMIEMENFTKEGKEKAERRRRRIEKGYVLVQLEELANSFYGCFIYSNLDERAF